MRLVQRVAMQSRVRQVRLVSCFALSLSASTLYVTALCAAAGASLLLPAQVAEAQGAALDATPKGTIGLGLIGAELGLVLPTAFGLSKTWSLITFPAVGGAGGAVAGYFLLDDPGRSNWSVGVLAAGIALAVPATLLAVYLSAYKPDSDPTMAPRPTGVLDMEEGAFKLAVPAVAVVHELPTEVKGEGVGNALPPELHVSVVSGRF